MRVWTSGPPALSVHLFGETTQKAKADGPSEDGWVPLG